MLTNYPVIEDINKAIEAGLFLEIVCEMQRLSPELYKRFKKYLQDKIINGEGSEFVRLEGHLLKLFMFATQKVNARHGIKDSLGAHMVQDFKEYVKKNAPDRYEHIKNYSDEEIGERISAILRTEEF